MDSNIEYNSDAMELWDQFSILVAYYKSIKGNYCGGNLHTILEDGNILDADILFCRRACVKSNDTLGLLLCDILLTWEIDTRDKVLKTGKWE